MKFTIFQDSRIGRRRDNQDRVAYCYSREALLMVVADGMGGHVHGELAAQVAVRSLTGIFERESAPRLPDPYLFLSWGLGQAHQDIIAYAEAHNLPEVPRTTCVACVVQDSVAYWAHAGDSRLYVIRGGRVLARTRDHSRVQMLIDEGRITAADARHHPDRNLVYSCLGGGEPPQIDFSRKTTLAAGDTILLCTDGVWGPLDEATLIHAFDRVGVSVGAPRLLDDAEARAGKSCDNLSLIALNWEENYGDDGTQTVETLTMPAHSQITLVEGGDSSMARDGALSEEDIDRAIEEIRGAIQRNSR